ncbi:MAG: integrase [Blastopirellula sp.]|nr:MAG: integrase [Blastopirellula sp.]
MVSAQRISKLTKRIVDAAVAREKRYIIWDRDLKGFGFRIEPTGVKTFLVRYRVGGGRRAPRRQMSIGRFGAITVEQARISARSILGDVAKGGDPAGEKAKARRVMTISELCTLYLQEGVSTKKESTLKVDQGRIDRHIVPLLGNRQITSITRADVEKFMKDVAEGKTAKIAKTKPRGKAVVRGGRGTATRTIGLLGGIFTFAISREFISVHPVRGIKRYADKKNERFLSLDELQTLGSILTKLEQEDANPTGIACLRLLALTGARKSEIVKLRWDEVDAGTGCLRLRDSKTGAKIIPLGQAALNLIADQPKIDESIWVFPSMQTQGKTPFAGIEKIWRKVRKKWEMPTIRIHDLRHSFASIGVANGTSLPVIGAILGHREVSTTQRYAHLADNPVRAATDVIAAQIDNALGGGSVMEKDTSHFGEDHSLKMEPNEIKALVKSLQRLLADSEAPSRDRMVLSK